MGQVKAFDKSVDDTKKYNKSIFACIERNQISFSGYLILALYLVHFTIPSLREYTSPFLKLQHQINAGENGTPAYDIGAKDVYYIATWIVYFTFVRSVSMKLIFAPVASRWFHMGHKTKLRFAEQMWCVVCYTGSFVFGFYLYYTSPYWRNLDNLYKGWPHDRMSSLCKGYYLASIGFWLQQIFVINVEQRRKDHYQMFSHHIITSCLMIFSYYYYYTRVGTLILTLMDCSDIFLSTAKVLKYCGRNILCDVMFLCFLVSWVVLRHGIYNYLLYFCWAYGPELMADTKCAAGLVFKRCWTNNVLNTFYGLLGLLQIILLIWMYLIVRVAYKVITGRGAEDVRSDSEVDEAAEEESKEFGENSSEETVTAEEDDYDDLNEKEIATVEVSSIPSKSK